MPVIVTVATVRHDGFRNRVSLTFDLWPFDFLDNACRATIMDYMSTVPSLVLIAQAVFFLERGRIDKQTDKQTDGTKPPTQAGGYYYLLLRP